ncbi:MAG: MBL fold metallo-hydrolase [Treponema sp.]|jgi:glyoxylase-like metal-dependent hydrolase (beta-lactamase superfamily II)|nr:MBL fold metallo-hydrolase [Treponema sp.]
MVNQVSVGELQTNCWIISLPQTDREASGGECILVDPGGDGNVILGRLKQLLLKPRYIVLTHAHFDHLAALPELAAAYPAAAVAVHPAETAKLGPHSLEPHRRDFNSAAGGAASVYVEALWKPLPEASLLLNEGDTLGPFTTLHLPGHSPGSIGLLWEEEKILISGDTLFNAGVGRTDLPGGDQKELNRSLARLFTLDGDTTVYPGHGPVTTIRRERGRS